MLKEVLVTSGARTPIGGFCGALAEVPAPALGGVAVLDGSIGSRRRR